MEVTHSLAVSAFAQGLGFIARNRSGSPRSDRASELEQKSNTLNRTTGDQQTETPIEDSSCSLMH